jgi:hypothetical protein
MKGNLFAIVFLLFGGVFVTANAQATGRSATSVLFELKAGQTKNIPGSEAKVKFLNVMEDSRCPEGTKCIWAGNAKVKLRVTNKRGAKVFDLNTAKGATDYSFEGYNIRLVKVEPKVKVNEHIRQREYVVTLTAISPGPTGKG